MELYIRNGSTQWSDAPNSDMGHLDEYDTLKYLGKESLDQWDKIIHGSI